MNQPNISIIIPCFNEEAGISNTFQKIKTYFSENLPQQSWEILFINDGSQDGTLEHLLQLKQKEPNIIIHSFDSNKGRGAALKAGLKLASGKILITLDADLSYDVFHIGDIINAFEKTPSADIVVVSAYMKKGITQGVPLKRLLISRAANWILSASISKKLSTVTCVVRGYRAETIQSMFLIEKNKEIHLEILRKAHLLGKNIIEIPGRLIWSRNKSDKKTKRVTNFNIYQSAKTHFLYALSVRPTLYVGIFALFLFAIGIYESLIISYHTFQLLDKSQTDFFKMLWSAMRQAYHESPHSFLIALGALITSIQIILFLVLLKVSKTQHEEILKHLLENFKPNQS